MARVRLAESPKDRAACLRLRWTVFVEEQGVPPSLEKDAHDEPSAPTLHALAEIDSARGEPVPAGAGRCIFVSPGVAKIQRMAVIDDARGRGVGAQLLAFLEGEARQRGAVRFTLSAQVGARGFYERVGYRAVGEVYDEAGIPHIDMQRDA